MAKENNDETHAGQPTPLTRYVLIPLAQAAASGLAAAVLALTLTGVACMVFHLPAKLMLIVAGVAFGACFGGLALHQLWRGDQFFYAIERALQRDLPFGPTHDGQVGEPQEQEPVFVNVYDRGRRHTTIKESLDFKYFIDELYGGISSGWHNYWKNQRLPSGRTLSQDEWSKWCQRLIDAGLATRPHDKAPLEMHGSKLDAMVAFRDYWPPTLS